ncbi:MAG: hypothetical protein GX607_05975 [Myxococcales bacterium]|jgi:multisubunit Na+/H+ antiporter MnhE subunit|nr:hypothetical protein [Myxococcales bacterium]
MSWARRIPVVMRLGAHFLGQVVHSGLLTAWLIVRPGPRPRSGLVRIGYENLSETGAAVLGCLVTLTPGSTAVDIDPERRELLLHLLDASNACAVASNIQRRFAIPLQRVFPEKG